MYGVCDFIEFEGGIFFSIICTRILLGVGKCSEKEKRKIIVVFPFEGKLLFCSSCEEEKCKEIPPSSKKEKHKKKHVQHSKNDITEAGISGNFRLCQ